MPNRTARQVTTLSVHYCKPLACYEIAIEANDGTTYLGRHYTESLRDLIYLIAEEIKELEREPSLKEVTEIACNKG